MWRAHITGLAGRYAAEGGANLTHEQHARLKEELESSFQGAANAGRPMVLEGGLDWKQMSLSPKEMEFIETKHVAAREIALAFGVPPMLLGIPGDNTFSNYAEANRTFWRQTVLPLVHPLRLAEDAANHHRITLIGRGFDARGLVAVEEGHQEREPEYVGAAGAYATGTPDGVRSWLRHYAAAVEIGAYRIAGIGDEVLTPSGNSA